MFAEYDREFYQRKRESHMILALLTGNGAKLRMKNP